MNQQENQSAAMRLFSHAQRSSRTMTQRCDEAITLAASLLQEANKIQTADERRVQGQLARMMEDPLGKAFTTSMTDQCFRSDDPHRIADQLTYLIDKFGVPHFLPLLERTGIHLFRRFGRFLPGLFVPLVKRLLRQEMSRVILPAEPALLAQHMRQRRQQGVRVNLNHLGEAVLGEEEAQHRLQLYLDDLAKPEVEYISVKVSTIYSQINLIGWEHTLDRLSKPLRKLYRASRKHLYRRPDGTEVPKFVNLDMEEYSDLLLTVELFCRVLGEEEFLDLSAGIVLQAYIPDSFAVQQKLTQWAIQRMAAKSAPIKIRIVKGANLAMEQVTAAMHGWQQAPYSDKGEVDANFKRMILYGMKPEHARAVHLGIGSHNLFDIAFALLLRQENGLEKEVCFEMLEGMADHIRRAVQNVSGDMLLYCPAASEAEFQNAIAYLIRRLDENTAPQNFLRHAFGLNPGSHAWQDQATLFRNSCTEADSVSSDVRRQQNRQRSPLKPSLQSPFANEPDTDWALPANRKWLETIVAEHKPKPTTPVEMATWQDVDAALNTASRSQLNWSALATHERSEVLWNVAQALRCHRAQLMEAMIFTCNKVAAEADIEIQEAIDFVEYYRREMISLDEISNVQWSAKGIVVIAPPWNFPCSIPVGGIAAALATGNAVLFKPAPEAIVVGNIVADAFWEGGISRDVLHFIPCEDDPVGSRLIQDSRVAVVVLTGATETARHLLRLRPGLDLLAETGGKNAMIVSCMADRDLAIRDVIQSAFGHAGQKCSACSLLICEAEVYDDPQFRRQLRDAAASWAAGSSWNFQTRLSPLIRPASGALLRALTTLEEGEEWLLQPRQDSQNPQLWSPGIKMGVKPGSFTHQTEFFGPVLALMRADSLDEAIRLANGTPYGLTSGLHSLDEREQQYWIERADAGNLYVNRGITGAIVQRQPFGGCKDSSFGPGAKAGGPNYLINFMKAEQSGLPEEKDFFSLPDLQKHLSPDDIAVWSASLSSYAHFWKQLFSKACDFSRIQGEDNLFTYRPRHVILRVQANDQAIGYLRVCAAARICGAKLEISSDVTLSIEATLETDEAFLQRMAAIPHVRVRLLQPPSEKLRVGLAEMGARIAIAPVFSSGRLELLHHLRELSISIDYHRYGNLGDRENEKRSPLRTVSP